MTEFNEHFDITYTGTVSDLTDLIESVNSVKSADTTDHAPYESVEEATLNYTIIYDAHATDRTTIANSLEEDDGVHEVIFA